MRDLQPCLLTLAAASDLHVREKEMRPRLLKNLETWQISSESIEDRVFLFLPHLSVTSSTPLIYTAIYLLLRSFHMSDVSRNTAEVRDAPTVSSTRIRPHPEEQPSRSASRKTWSSVGGHVKRERFRTCFQGFLLLLWFFSGCLGELAQKRTWEHAENADHKYWYQKKL